MCRSMSAARSPRASLALVDSASAVPASSTKVGAHRWVIQRVRNCAVGSGVPGTHCPTLSPKTRPLLKACEA